MLKSCSWLLALAGLLGVASASHAGTPPITSLLLPHLFGQDVAPQGAPTYDDPLGYPVSPVYRSASSERAAPAPDLDWLHELICDGLELLMDCGPEVRMVVQHLQPCSPYHLAAAAFFEYLSTVEYAQRAAIPVAGGIGVGGTTPPACCKDCPVPACEVLPYPKVVSGPQGCPLGYSGFAVGAAPVAACGTCPKVGTCPLPAHCEVADTCANACAASKACKCCEDCKDCKSCTCSKTFTFRAVTATPAPVFFRGINGECIQPTMPLPPAPTLPPYLSPYTMAPMPHPCMMPPIRGMIAHHPLPELPPCPLEELHELHRQRQMISLAIAQVEQELARIAHHQQLAQQQMVQAMSMPVAHHNQKVHLVTERFEAHCDSLRCAGDAHRLVLEGNVRLCCKHSGQCVNIEAPCVIVNMKDGTFTVESRSVPVQPTSAQGVQLQGAPIMIWTPDLSQPCPGSMGSDGGRSQPALPRPSLPWRSVVIPASPSDGDR
jgi:hypothetical protein